MSMNRIFLRTPVMNISSKELGQWVMFDMGTIRSAWMNLINQHYKFIETYFKRQAADICDDPYMILEHADEVEKILQDEQRNSFGTVWNRSFFIITEDPPQEPVGIPNAAGAAVLEGEIKTLASMILSQRLFMVFQKQFPRILEHQILPQPDQRQHFSSVTTNPSGESVYPKINYMRIFKAYSVPFTNKMTSNMRWTLDHVGKGFALQRNGVDISVRDKIEDIRKEGYRIIVPDVDIKQANTCVALCPIVLNDKYSHISSCTKYLVDIYKDDQLWKQRHGTMISYAFMEMWYKLFAQMSAEKCKNFTIVLTHAQAPDPIDESAHRVKNKEES